MLKRKKKILDIMSSLNNKNRDIKNSIHVGVFPQMELLADCQQQAICMGDLLETYEGNGGGLVRILEDYCECLYQISASQNIGQCRKLMKKIRKQMTQLHNGIYLEIPEDRREIVFFPYKASMWDSLESVWKAAAGDGRCDVYVVPIPYFDRKPDGTFGEMHYEGAEYPEDVPVVFWKDFLAEEHRPDIVYIHNPYDQYNYVTSVHPDFYASKLRNNTDKLVYIPYFTALDGEVPRHFVTLPGVLYAHKVIVQSERARQIYIEELHKFEKQNHCENLYGKPEEKLLALGSPKYDKVLTTKREDISIPLEWQRIINGQGLT